MSGVGSTNPLLLSSSAPTAYQISRSLRFTDYDDLSRLSRTNVSPTNQSVYTLSLWVKRTRLGEYGLFGATGFSQCYFMSGGALRWYDAGADLTTTAVFRDPCAWGHLVFVLNGTSYKKIYYNGTEIASIAGVSSSPMNAAGQIQYLGYAPGSGFEAWYSGYLADVHFVDGQALLPSSFGEFDLNGVWQPKAYSGSYGANGFQLKLADNSNNTATTLGKDTSGNNNNFTPSNLSVTAGAANDSLVDTPTNYGSDSGIGGEVRGNYCTLNPLRTGTSGVLSEGNLHQQTPTNNNGFQAGTFGVSSGKWYWEVTYSGSFPVFGLVKDANPVGNGTILGWDSTSWAYVGHNGYKTHNSSNVAYGSQVNPGDVVGVALDADNGTLTFYVNGTSQGVAFTGLTSGPYYPACSDYNNATSALIRFNFGQRPFAYTAPSGFKTLCSTNLPKPTIENGSTAMDVKLYAGNGSTQTISGLGFSPDLIWIKKRSGAEGHLLSDTVRGIDNGLYSNQTVIENTFQIYGKVSAVTFSSFTVATTTDTPLITNQSGSAYVAWAWDAGSSTVTNTAGSITSQVRANPSAGFSIVTYTGGASNSTVGHGLGVSPGLIIAKSRNNLADATGWAVYHSSVGGGAFLSLNGTSSAQLVSGYWGTPNSTTFGVSSSGFFNNNGSMVAYCFAPVAGYSSFGSYTGNGSADGPFVYTGFRPRWILVKSSSSNATNWIILDSARDSYNVSSLILRPDLASAEISDALSSTDFLANGFKLRGPSSSFGFNISGTQYVYAAFAEHPFQYARAR